MAWCEFHDTLKDHPKTLRTGRMLGLRPVYVMGHLGALWTWALEHAQDGDLTDLDPEDIATAAAWDGKPQDFTTALLGCGKKGGAGFLERTPDGRLVLHDWHDYAGKLIDRRKEDADRKKAARASKEHPADVPRTPDDGEKRRTPPPAPLGAIEGNGTGTPPRSNVDDSLLRKAETRGKAEKGPDILGDGAPGDVSQPGASHPEDVRGMSDGRRTDGVRNPTVPYPTVPKEEGGEPGLRPSSAPPTPLALVEAWNRARGALPAIVPPLSSGREVHARTRLRAVPDLPRWEAAIERLSRSPFANGSNDRGWRANLDFLLRPDTLSRIEEGHYENHGGNGEDPAIEAKRKAREVAERAQQRRDVEESNRELEAAREMRRKAGLST